MNKRLILLTMVILLSLSAFAFAHPPQELTANFDLESNILEVDLMHRAGGENNNHYIGEILIFHNEEEVLLQNNTKQLDDGGRYPYFLPAVEEGDSLKVIARCNIAGERIFELLVEAEEVELEKDQS